MDKTIVEVVDSGVMGGEKQLRHVIDVLHPTVKKAVLAKDVKDFTNWWVLETVDHKKMFYLGTLESFEKFKKYGIP